jgi:hypothetical protein
MKIFDILNEGSGQEPGMFEFYNTKTLARVFHPFEADNIEDAFIKADDFLEAIGKSGKGLSVRPVRSQGVAEEKQRLDPKCWDGYKKQGTKMKGGVRVNNCVPESSDPADVGEYDREGEMAMQQLSTAEDAAQELRSILDSDENLPEWVQSKITKAVDYLDTVRDYMKSNDDVHEETYNGNEFYEAYGELWYDEETLTEAEYQGRKVPLGKPMRGDVKKFKVYVKDPKTGNVKKVNFGDPNMKIKKSNPARRKSFRARHNCDNPGPRTKARYWSCRKW